jgi:hypothetical protein
MVIDMAFNTSVLGGGHKAAAPNDENAYTR